MQILRLRPVFSSHQTEYLGRNEIGRNVTKCVGQMEESCLCFCSLLKTSSEDSENIKRKERSKMNGFS